MDVGRDRLVDTVIMRQADVPALQNKLQQVPAASAQALRWSLTNHESQGQLPDAAQLRLQLHDTLSRDPALFLERYGAALGQV